MVLRFDHGEELLDAIEFGSHKIAQVKAGALVGLLQRASVEWVTLELAPPAKPRDDVGPVYTLVGAAALAFG